MGELEMEPRPGEKGYGNVRPIVQGVSSEVVGMSSEESEEDIANRDLIENQINIIRDVNQPGSEAEIGAVDELSKLRLTVVDIMPYTHSKLSAREAAIELLKIVKSKERPN